LDKYKHQENFDPEEQEEERDRRLHPITLASIAHYNLARIHPFEDGNGRGARILMNLILMRNKYYPAIIKREDRIEYITTLNQANDGDIFPFLVLVANSVLETERIIYLDSKIMMEEE
jgi:Fic family protein